MIIEFIGLPGAGKTTLKGAIIKNNKHLIDQRFVFLEQKMNIKFIYLLQKLTLGKNGNVNLCGRLLITLFKYSYFKEVSWRKESWDILISALLQDDDGHHQKTNASKLMLAIESYSAFSLAKNSENSYLFDEGVAQRGITLARASFNEKLIYNYYKKAYKPDVLFILDANDSILKRRIQRRDNDLRLVRKRREMRKAVSICKDIYAKKGVKIVEIDGSKKTSDMLKSVNNEIYLSKKS